MQCQALLFTTLLVGAASQFRFERPDQGQPKVMSSSITFDGSNWGGHIWDGMKGTVFGNKAPKQWTGNGNGNNGLTEADMTAAAKKVHDEMTSQSMPTFGFGDAFPAMGAPGKMPAGNAGNPMANLPYMPGEGLSIGLNNGQLSGSYTNKEGKISSWTYGGDTNKEGKTSSWTFGAEPRNFRGKKNQHNSLAV
eukprot:gnl/MRDRNA2_/MRDRNA2_56730_c0_seq1.p1 gnl/MRDRNA2_/MRDRNA2_56730_c0~~gnl/MRDRNA2_/MRDRNA2_56730_c0_seq1.p1  ORF type:complete len:193 (-),score=48.87 gnl/MRDRNA2_/MRDRNA2_56730_c0_seq1:28-606(-)